MACPSMPLAAIAEAVVLRLSMAGLSPVRVAKEKTGVMRRCYDVLGVLCRLHLLTRIKPRHYKVTDIGAWYLEKIAPTGRSMTKEQLDVMALFGLARNLRKAKTCKPSKYIRKADKVSRIGDSTCAVIAAMTDTLHQNHPALPSNGREARSMYDVYSVMTALGAISSIQIGTTIKRHLTEHGKCLCAIAQQYSTTDLRDPEEPPRDPTQDPDPVHIDDAFDYFMGGMFALDGSFVDESD